uniref:Chaperone protein dnaJ n=2 Tax=Cajanus cajan TaxID=3821 RepID=A0A151QZ40_CAJCA|nr:Chaperone protein dnaJ [Cajanus cajan]
MNKPMFTRLFHSTPLLERKSRTFLDSKCNHYSRRFRRLRAKQTLLRDINAHAQFMFQSWKGDIDEDDPSPSQDPSWFRKQYSPKGPARHGSGNQRSKHRLKRDHEFCKDDFDIETVFRSAFGGNRSFYWSFINEENPQWKRSGGFSSQGKSWNQRRQSENKYGSSTKSESDCSYSDSISERLALGLSAYGPLKLEEVKNAYRICALKWHPDRHQGSSKVIAEEKFKHCSSAYQSLCDKLALD